MHSPARSTSQSCAAARPKLRSIRATRAALGAPCLRLAAPPPCGPDRGGARRRTLPDSAEQARRSAEPRRLDLPAWALVACAFGGAAGGKPLVMTMTTPWRVAPGLEAGLVESHVRSLQVSHLTDVATSDQHTVKPLVQRQGGFRASCRRPRQPGFPLAGGRLDYVGGTTGRGARLSSQRARHQSLYLAGCRAGEPVDHLDGYNLMGWRQAGLRSGPCRT